MRDGARLYADIYRSPETSSSNRVPALLGLGPFRKKFSGLSILNMITPWSVGVPDSHLSGLDKFESPDPAEWIRRGGHVAARIVREGSSFVIRIC